MINDAQVGRSVCPSLGHPRGLRTAVFVVLLKGKDKTALKGETGHHGGLKRHLIVAVGINQVQLCENLGTKYWILL